MELLKSDSVKTNLKNRLLLSGTNLVTTTWNNSHTIYQKLLYGNLPLVPTEKCLDSIHKNTLENLKGECRMCAGVKGLNKLCIVSKYIKKKKNKA